MSPLAIILKAESTPDGQTIAYETYRKQTIIVVQQDYQLDAWIRVIHMALPIVIFDFIQSFQFDLISERPYERSSILAGFCNVLCQRVCF